MGRLFYANFDVESQWGKPRSVSPADVQRRSVELATVWLALAEAKDCLLLPVELEAGFLESLAPAGLSVPRIAGSPADVPSGMEFRPWGWSQPAIDFATQQGWNARAPSIDLVRRANSRRFSIELETEFGTGLDGAAVIRSPAELERALAALSAERWVVKAEFGMSARERILGRGRQLTEPQRNWVAKRLQGDAVVVLEPWVEIIAEAGLQFTLPVSADEPIRLEGVTPLLTDAQGAYRGSRFDDETPGSSETPGIWPQPAVDVALRAAERIRSLGYFGPLGIDAAQYRAADGTIRDRPLQDVNARHTMGRLSLGLRRLLNPDETGVWLHQRWPTDDVNAPRRWFEEFQSTLPQGTRIVRTSPFMIDGQPVGQGTVAVICNGESPA